MENTLLNMKDIDFDRIYIIYFPKLVRFARTYLLDREDAENIVQDIFLQLWESADRSLLQSSLNAYLFTIVKNRCIDALRKYDQMQNKHCELSDLERKEFNFKLYSLQRFDDNHLTLPEIEQIIQQAIDSLPLRCREIFLLSRMEGLKHKEIAERLQLSVNTVEGQISIALRKLRVALKDYMPLFILIC